MDTAAGDLISQLRWQLPQRGSQGAVLTLLCAFCRGVPFFADLYPRGEFFKGLCHFESFLSNKPKGTQLQIDLPDIEEVNNADKELIDSVKTEIEYIKSKADILDSITSKIEDKSLRRRVCHNDTKLSNVMMDEKTGRYMCLIDLDTAMKGAIAYDFGDAIRGGASTAAEDETDLSKVTIDLELTRAFTEGFIYELRKRKKDDKFLEPSEAKSLYDGLFIIALELGMRFLEDYILGNIYFKINEDRPLHNLERARNQLKLANEIEKHRDDIVKIINDSLKANGFDDSFLLD